MLRLNTFYASEIKSVLPSTRIFLLMTCLFEAISFLLVYLTLPDVADHLYRMSQQTEHEGDNAIWIPEIHEVVA